MELIHTFYIEDNGHFKAIYVGVNGLTELDKNIVRSEYEITDNQLREQINKMVNDISCYVLKMASMKGFVYPSRMYYGETVGLGEDAKPTCKIISHCTGRHAICEPLNSNYPPQQLDCRKCNVPQVYKEEARGLLRQPRKG